LLASGSPSILARGVLTRLNVVFQQHLFDLLVSKDIDSCHGSPHGPGSEQVRGPSRIPGAPVSAAVGPGSPCRFWPRLSLNWAIPLLFPPPLLPPIRSWWQPGQRCCLPSWGPGLSPSCISGTRPRFANSPEDAVGQDPVLGLCECEFLLTLSLHGQMVDAQARFTLFPGCKFICLKRRQIESITEWVTAFTMYMVVLLQKHPSNGTRCWPTSERWRNRTTIRTF
jgi:hypothetical protein